MLRKIILAMIALWLVNTSSSYANVWPLLPVNTDQDWALPSTVVIIDVGHGGIDGGASAADILEKDINLAVARKLYLLLRSQGIPAVMNRTGDYALSEDNRWHITRSRHRKDLSQRRQLTEEIESELLVSLHVNWSKKGSRRGPLVLHQKRGESALLAFCIQDALNRQQNTAFLPREGKPYFLLKQVKQPAVIIEMGYISSDNDRSMLTDPRRQQDVAAAIASGIRQYRWVVH
ncbi:N-acetylmuramoyl-L-alanine amidase [Paenibacillus alkaliterrae]|uniref:N-acetylmuramoyl-L-alanine amidase family protein n=1 Tax=Paenibacillus alkaliterrae TaxID=320909 RepID=UPI001F1BDAF2|nr:N-acetylmuramoyl-L-alanine amidase [Paenibacillus alkaliterrae]MCF2939860.1 N-acetylmuramoyl-L-alanine amidase [Paenibacillus alkaliterrae]